MQTHFTQEQLAEPAIAYSNEELRACLQCGYCLPNCPTYQLLGNEFDSPRGRTLLIKEMLEKGDKPEKNTVTHIDRCLSCLACMSSCPSSVHYMHLVDHARQVIEANYRRPLFDRVLRWAMAKTLPYPDRFRQAMRLARTVKPWASALPKRVRGMIELVPDMSQLPSPNDKPQIFPASGERKHRVALLTGCVQRALNTDINDATIRILRRHGCDVVIVKGAGCCGALTYHMGKSKEAYAAAAKNIHAWMKEINSSGLDAIVVNTSGCGTVVKDYGYMFRNHTLAQEAATVASLAKDVSELLSELKMDVKVRPGLRVAYHATCSLQFGQQIRFIPKKLLKAAGFTVLEPRDSKSCCGSAGTFSLLQPEISNRLKAQKVKTLEQGTPDLIAAGNIGCMVQIASGTDVPVVHTVQLLDWVTGGPVPPALQPVPPALQNAIRETVAAQ